MNYLLCGMAVDEEFYSRYRGKAYIIQGNMYSMQEIIALANSKLDAYPQLKEQAQKIVKQVQAEIKEHYAAKDGRKEKTMKHNTFGEYLADLRQIHAKAAQERIALKEKWDAAQEQWKRDKMDFRDDEHYLARQKVKYLDAQENYKNSVEELQMRTQGEIEAVQAELERHVTDFYAADGSRIDDGTVRLFNSGIRLTDAEIDRIIGQNKGNPTMLRLIADYCGKMKMNNKNAAEFGLLARKAGADEREAFKAVADMVRNAVSDNETTSSVWSKPDSHFKRLSDEQIGIVDGLQVRPETNKSQTASQDGE